MAKPLHAEEAEEIKRRFAGGETMAEIQKSTGRSQATLRKVLSERKEAESEPEPVPAKRNIEAYMSEKTPEVCKMIDLYLSAMCSPEKIEDATLSQLSHAFSSVVDKFLKDRGGEQKNVEVSLQVPESWTK